MRKKFLLDPLYKLIITTVLILSACQSQENNNVQSQDFLGYEMSHINASEAQIAIKYGASGRVLERGVVANGQKHGMWVIYHDDVNNLPQKITSYVNGMKNGPEFSYNNRGQIEESNGFINEVVDGLVAKYRFGRPTISTYYQNGELHGRHTEFFNDGKPQKIVDFKNGKQDGILQYLDESGNITLEYTYKNGEKVSGGLVE